jgi:ribonucleoside-triphosphate reductase
MSEYELDQYKRELLNVKGTPCEVYSRIVGYYRNVNNWNRGKRSEYSERKTFDSA